MATTYSPSVAGALVPGDKVRPLAALGPSVPKAGFEDYPWTVESVLRGRGGRVRVWAYPHGARVSIQSPTLYGHFNVADTVEVAE